jgi:hypothetical protein
MLRHKVLRGVGASVVALAITLAAHAAVDGNTYAVIAPTYRAATGAESYIRFFSGGSAASTFTVRIVGSPSGNILGTTTVPVPANAELQRSLSTLLAAAGVTGLTGSDTGYSIYLQNPDASAGYQHVIFSSVTSLFENASNCKIPLNQVIGANGNKAALIGVHTSALSAYPSSLYIHNYRAFGVSYKLTAYDAATGTQICPAGSTNCTVTLSINANETMTKNFSEIETALGWTPTSAQPHANVFITDPSLTVGAPLITLSQAIRNATLNGNIDMSTACAVNALASSNPIASAASTIFDGTVASTGLSGSITVTIAGSGSASASAPVALETAQSIERQQASLTATGSLRLQGQSSNVSLTGSYNTLTNALTLTGGSYSFSGSVVGATAIDGTYTGPSGVSGAFSMRPGTLAAPPTTYCGNYTGVDTGKFNFAINSTSGTISGTYKPSDDEGGTLWGSVTSTGHFSGNNSYGTEITGTFSANGTSGTYRQPDGGTGSFTGSVCTGAR